MGNPANRLAWDVALIADCEVGRWLIETPERTAAVAAFYKGLGEKAAEPEWMGRYRQALEPRVRHEDGVAIVPIHGALMHSPDIDEMMFYGAEDTRAVAKVLKAAGDNAEAKAIVLDIHSPGGMVTGGSDLVDEVRKVAAKKPVVAWTGGMSASLAYWLGSQAHAVMASRGAITGSIGAYMVHTDISRLFADRGIKAEVFANKDSPMKAAGVPYVPLTDHQRERMQARIEGIAAGFKKDVLARRPGIKPEAMNGETYYGTDAKALGLIDEIGSLADAVSLARYRSR